MNMEAIMDNTLKLFWAVSLHFDSPVHIGSGDSEEYIGAANIVRNGAGEYVIPGTSLAGLFATRLHSTAMVKHEEQGSSSMIVNHSDIEELSASHLVFRTVILKPKNKFLRDRVRINPETKTAADKAKFAQWEILPQNTTFIIELDNVSKQDRLSDEQMASIQERINQVLASWNKESFFIGAHASVGNGFAKVISVKRCSLCKENYAQYLATPISELHKANMNWESINLDDIKFKPVFRRRYRLILKTGLHDPILIKGNSYYPSDTNPETDSPFVNRAGDIFVPGSSIRGAITAFMRKYGVKDWLTLCGQPQAQEQNQAHEDEPTKSSILFTDLKLVKDDKVKIVKLEHHAEDQFSRAVWGPGKFDEERAFNASFVGEILVADTYHQYDPSLLDRIFSFLMQGMKHRMISLGAGSAYPQMELEEIPCENFQ